MNTVTLRWSADRSLYFVEPPRGTAVRGFWLGAEKHEIKTLDPALIRNPYSGVAVFENEDGSAYFRRWFSMRGFIVRQSEPTPDVPASEELVVDYFRLDKFLTVDEAWILKRAADIGGRLPRLANKVHTEGDSAHDTEAAGETPAASGQTFAEAHGPESRASEREKDPEAAAGFSSGGRPPKREKKTR